MARPTIRGRLLSRLKALASPDDRLTDDGRQSPIAAAVQRGAMRLLYHHGFQALSELTLKTGRRVDIAALNPKGQITIVEIKSSLADFQADTKWHDYLDWADRFYFAVPPDFPADILPPEQGLIFADRFGGEIIRDAPHTPLAPARRKALTILFATTAARRVFSMQDPEGPASLNA